MIYICDKFGSRTSSPVLDVFKVSDNENSGKALESDSAPCFLNLDWNSEDIKDKGCLKETDSKPVGSFTVSDLN